MTAKKKSSDLDEGTIRRIQNAVFDTIREELAEEKKNPQTETAAVYRVRKRKNTK